MAMGTTRKAEVVACSRTQGGFPSFIFLLSALLLSMSLHPFNLHLSLPYTLTPFQLDDLPPISLLYV